jgi:hypothetical protein
LARPDWSLCLPQPLNIPTIMKLVTLADIRELIGHLPKEFRDKSTWRHVQAELAKAVEGADPVDVAVALRLALNLERVECRPL